MKRKQKSPRPKEPVLSQALQESIVYFLEHHPPQRVSRNLRKMLAEFPKSKNTVESPRSNNIEIDMEGLFALLDVAEHSLRYSK